MRVLARGGWRVQLLMLAGLAVPLSAVAAPVDYINVGGSVTITITAGINTLAVLPGIPLTGTKMTFDADADPGNALTDFQLDIGAVNFTLSIPYAGRDVVALHSVSIRPGAGYVSNVVLNLSAGGVDNYTMISAGALNVTANFSALNSSGPPPPAIGGNLFTFSVPGASGKIFISGNSMNMTQVGVVLGIIGPLGNESVPLVISGNFFFQGLAVPEPHTAALVGFGLVALTAFGRRARRVNPS